MIVVADHLTITAQSKTSELDVDLFARSAFNRYYYAVYLIVKESISEINNSWGRVSHKNLPDLLTGKILTTIKRKIKQQVKNNLLNQSEGDRIKQKVIHSANELSNLMSLAYSIRVIADYEIETKVEVVGSTIMLASEKISTAKHWKKTAQIHTYTIIQAYKDVGLI